jgi:hypothetical protein
MSKTFDAHLAAIRSGEITKTNVIGLRKALTALNKREAGWSVSRTQVKVTARDLDTACDELDRVKPRVVGELHDTGLAQLQAKRYRRQLASVAEIVAGIASFHLVGFELVGSRQLYATPLYEARDAEGRAFRFINIPWQNGGNGPEIV